MSYEPDDEATVSDLQDAAENNDMVTNDELQEMHPDLNMAQIAAKFEADERELNAQAATMPEEPRYEARKGMKSFHSGPKGVIADFNEAKLKQRAKRIEENLRRKEKLYMTLGSSNPNQIQPFHLKYTKKSKKDKSDSKHDSDSEESDLDDSDDEAIQIYKQEKLKQIQKYRDRYGSCMEVTAWTFEEKVEQAPKNVVTVMHVYQDVM